jgi:hypothetical protein
VFPSVERSSVDARCHFLTGTLRFLIRAVASAPVVPDMTRKPSTPTSSSSSPPTKRFLSMFSKSKSDNQPNQPKPFNAGPGNSPRDRQKAAEVDCPTSQGAKS